MASQDERVSAEVRFTASSRRMEDMATVTPSSARYLGNAEVPTCHRHEKFSTLKF